VDKGKKKGQSIPIWSPAQCSPISLDLIVEG
jgi:hypothetical protein